MDVINSHSSVSNLSRVFAFILRFVKNIKNQENHNVGVLSPKETKKALNKIIGLVQQAEFKTEIDSLTKNKEIPISISLKSVNPILNDNLLSVGGRLQNSNLYYNEKHPIILPKGHQITKIIIHQMHLRTLHSGIQLVIASIRHTYWIINMRNAVRQQIHRCIKCFRFGAQRCSQLMGNFSKPRITIDRTIDIRMTKGRGAKSYKGYITLFMYSGNGTNFV